ncbi:hypothetical protein AURDEDRAFT_173477 [Auricularia subglabra TFB-10046 SS5]|nr:hypothetical protein AURDEDRAFT_173477 [Auricularia subglabra TFB-10046 SS5]
MALTLGYVDVPPIDLVNATVLQLEKHLVLLNRAYNTAKNMLAIVPADEHAQYKQRMIRYRRTRALVRTALDLHRRDGYHPAAPLAPPVPSPPDAADSSSAKVASGPDLPIRSDSRTLSSSSPAPASQSAPAPPKSARPRIFLSPLPPDFDPRQYLPLDAKTRPYRKPVKQSAPPPGPLLAPSRAAPTAPPPPPEPSGPAQRQPSAQPAAPKKARRLRCDRCIQGGLKCKVADAQTSCDACEQAEADCSYK